MIDQEQAKKLKVRDILHLHREGIKCEEWKVVIPYTEYEEGWFVALRLGRDRFARIREANKEGWHFPGECSPASLEGEDKCLTKRKP